MKLHPLQFVVVLLAAGAWAQSEGDAPLGDVARNIRRAKVTTKAADVRVDNDNFSKIMENSEARRMMSATPQLSLSLGPMIAGAAVAAPDVSCCLSFSARGIRLSDSLGPPPAKELAKDPVKDLPAESEPLVVEDSSLPASELAKIEGPATIIGDSLQLSVYNGTAWQVEEITVGLTILRHPSHMVTSSLETSARIVPVSSVQIVAKRSDSMIVYHFKGSAAPESRATFTQPLGITLGPDQEWHWAIIETPPSAGLPVSDGRASCRTRKPRSVASHPGPLLQSCCLGSPWL